eukprot:scaffold7734_cov592-Prasinococcus_capsulatus_cf.AAC.4
MTKFTPSSTYTRASNRLDPTTTSNNAFPTLATRAEALRALCQAKRTAATALATNGSQQQARQHELHSNPGPRQRAALTFTPKAAALRAFLRHLGNRGLP